MDFEIYTDEPIGFTITCDNPDIIEVVDAEPVRIVVSITKDGKDGAPGQDAVNNTLEMVRAENPTIAGNIDADGSTIVNLRDAEAPQEPATLHQLQTTEQVGKEYSDASITQLIDNAANDANTLKKLSDKINAINSIIGGSDPDGNSIIDTVAELLVVFSTYPEGSDVATILAGKLNSSDIIDNLNQVVSGKVLDAAQGNVLKNLIDALTIVVDSKWTAVDATNIIKGIMRLYTGIGIGSDGTMTQNAITTALGLKANLDRVEHFLFSRCGLVLGGLTNDTSERIVYSIDISAGTFLPSDWMRYLFDFRRAVGGSECTVKVKLGPTGTTADPTIATVLFGTSNLTSSLHRMKNRVLNGNTIETLRTNLNATTDLNATTITGTTPFNYGIDQKLSIAVTLANGADTFYLVGAQLSKIKSF